MKSSKQLDTSSITFKSAMLFVMLMSVAIPFFNGIFSSSGFNVPFFISSVVGLGVGTPLTYYFLNNKNFQPMYLPKFALTMVINILVSSVIAIATSYIIITLF